MVYLDGGRTVVIDAPGAGDRSVQAVAGLRVNGIPSDRAWISLEHLTREPSWASG